MGVEFIAAEAAVVLTHNAYQVRLRKRHTIGHLCKYEARYFTRCANSVASGISYRFYSAPQCWHCKRCISYGNTVRPSVCPSHAGIVSRQRHVARCSLHCWIAKCVSFCRNQKKYFPRDDPFPLKFWLQVTYPLMKAASFDTFCLVAPQP